MIDAIDLAYRRIGCRDTPSCHDTDLRPSLCSRAQSRGSRRTQGRATARVEQRGIQSMVMVSMSTELTNDDDLLVVLTGGPDGLPSLLSVASGPGKEELTPGARVAVEFRGKHQHFEFVGRFISWPSQSKASDTTSHHPDERHRLGSGRPLILNQRPSRLGAPGGQSLGATNGRWLKAAPGTAGVPEPYDWLGRSLKEGRDG
ncbi:hypothetical protein E1287_32150 [Actinomadura sp. KC06]|uniref:hypothetical protein n=1 Tax=Actinomadura sp. KC06 TaxID=2530369 RepID=UPI00104E3183|nr:hypothetical protein [Actinomadura sp. KC06]TDD28860.1 hypothetical protein E1287_32150 [Actinomadura sp. KC06]